MNILIVSQWCHPEPEFKALIFARELQRAGHRVRILTGFPNYPGGKVYAGYRVRPWQIETIEGVEILRVPLYPSHDQGVLGRCLNYASFALSASVLGLFWAAKADVAYVYHPPASVALPGMVFRHVLGIPCVYDIQDLWPDTLAATGMVRNPRVMEFVGLWCSMVYRAVDQIAVLSPGFKRCLVQRGVPADKITVIRNWSAPSGTEKPGELPGAEKARLAGKFNVLFAGNMGPAQALDTVLDCALLTQAELPDVQYVFVGGGIELDRLKQRVQSERIENVLFLPRRPVQQMAAVFEACAVLLVHLNKDPLFEITIPSKTQAYLAAGKPVLMAVSGDAAELIVEGKAGLTCEPQNAPMMAQTVKRFRHMNTEDLTAMGRRGERYYRDHLAIDVGARAFVKLFKRVASESGVVL